MVRKDTNRHYSLRKLKKGTASVAVALSVLGAGLASQTEVKADNVGRVDVDKIREEALHQAIGGMTNVQLRNTLAGSFRMNDELKKTIQEKEQELKNLKDNVELEQLKNERHDHDEEAERKALEDKLADKQEHLDGALRYINEKEAERKALEDKLADKQEHLDGALRYINEKEAERKEKEAEQKKLKEEKQISDASRQGLRRDLDASREAKKQVEKDLANLTAELDKVKEEKQISDASRQGLRRDLDASREAKKQVEKALEEANSKLAALEKLNKELEESKKLTEKEKAELQAKLEAEAKALKEQLAKQAEELAKLRAEKASDSQTPDAKPGNKAVPGKGQAPQAGTKPNQNKAPMKETKRQLPSTGEAANPFFTAAALTVMATAGVAAVVKRKEEN
ncbi:M protein [Streptococcus pyogenes]|uniref:M protein n=1 Tax=Streptococcus pyogenes TaxID=1314 RepID=UPI00109D1C4C|nr:M protein [Streptococcus pyogenes]VGT08780.1 plasminogen-binding group A steptococcal M-like protein PAM [Streptococcus pyogenes]VGX16380.1 plasminogen-binding group A steptococcal M-like protein PAM [Streptococcus pyogenes]VGX18233.1 plasminogen-binding group A steptococcal M-like protein PAM [Streptococcus pyogenes]VGX18799.1 plasminogen-binding group A steptococcal M-like protein PAM [Streptococcus pyogenes]VHH85341.1 plasminogen-binding group A steptococcal M-like protein PAM [Streptoco